MLDDHSIVIAISIAVVVAFQQWKQRPDASRLSRLGRASLVAMATGSAAFFASYEVQSFNDAHKRSDALNKIMAQTEGTPFIGAILRDEPQYEPKLREAIQANNGSGRALVVEMRTRYAKPTFWSAPDDTVMAASEQAAKVRDYLEKESPRICSEYMMAGIKNLAEVSPQGQQVYNDSLKAMEKVYQEGKGQPPRAVPLKDEQNNVGFDMRGLTQPEIDALNNKGSDEQRCSASKKMYAVVYKLKPEHKVIFARYLLSLG